MPSSPTSRLLGFALRHRRQYVVGVACTVAATTMSLAGPWVLKYAVDDLTAGVTFAKLRLYAAGLLGLALIGGYFRFLMRRVLVGASRDIEYDLRNAFFGHLLTLPAAYFQANRTGDLMSRATNDLNAVRMMIGPAVMYSTSTIIVFGVALALMLSLDAWLTFVALIPLPFVSIAVKLFGTAIHRRFERIQAQLAQLSAVAQEALAGVRVVRAYRQEESELRRFDDANREYVRRNLKLVRLQGMFFPSLGLFLGFGALLVLWLGSQEVIRGRLTLGEFVAFNAYLAMLTWPMIAFGWVTNMLQRGNASWRRMLEVMDTVPAIADGPGAAGPRPIRGAIEFRDLTFAYDGRPVLSGVSLTVPPGTTTAIVGRTGSGKSTLIGLLPRIFDPPPGTVFLDGVDVRRIPLAELRAAIGFVAQEPFLFSSTIADNVAFGLPADAAGLDGTVERSSAVARLDKDVASFPERMRTIVGERGITLSGGQRQRAAIARALSVDPRVLVLDDALSAVDTYTEEEILARLRGVMRERTSIIVAHRMSTVRDADQIVVLDAGRIVERGRHEDLLALDGVYGELYRKQLLEEELGQGRP